MKIFSWNSIKLRWKFEWRFIPRDIKNGFQNLYYWIPVIWKTRDWDYSYLYEIIRFKLKRMVEYNKKYPRYVGVERNVELMETTIRIIEKLEDAYYSTEYQSYNETTFEFVDSDKEGFYELKTDIIKENFDDYFSKQPNELKEVINEYPDLDITIPKDKQTIAFYISLKKHEKAKNLLFKMLNNYTEGWWN